MIVYCHKCHKKVSIKAKDERCPKCGVVLWEIASRKYLTESKPCPKTTHQPPPEAKESELL